LDATIEVYPDSKIEGMEPYSQCFWTLIFRTKVVKVNRGETWPGSYSTIRSGRSLGAIFWAMIDQFVSERVLIPDTSFSHTSPLVIVHKMEGGIRMAVDYREVNQFLRVSSNQLPYQDMLFQQLADAKVYKLWGYHQLKLDKQSSRVTAIITP